MLPIGGAPLSAVRSPNKPLLANALAVEAFNDLLKKYGKRQSVENPLLD